METTKDLPRLILQTAPDLSLMVPSFLLRLGDLQASVVVGIVYKSIKRLPVPPEHRSQQTMLAMEILQLPLGSDQMGSDIIFPNQSLLLETGPVPHIGDSVLRNLGGLSNSAMDYLLHRLCPIRSPLGYGTLSVSEGEGSHSI